MRDTRITDGKKEIQAKEKMCPDSIHQNIVFIRLTKIKQKPKFKNKCWKMAAV